MLRKIGQHFLKPAQIGHQHPKVVTKIDTTDCRIFANRRNWLANN